MARWPSVTVTLSVLLCLLSCCTVVHADDEYECKQEDAYYFFSGRDCPGGDINPAGVGSLGQAKAACDNATECVGFNSVPGGWFKGGCLRNDWDPSDDPAPTTCPISVGFYAKPSWISSPAGPSVDPTCRDTLAGGVPSAFPVAATSDYYVFFQGLDCQGGDIGKKISTRDARRLCDADTSCLGFNADGHAKFNCSSVCPRRSAWWDWARDSTQGFFAKCDWLMDKSPAGGAKCHGGIISPFTAPPGPSTERPRTPPHRWTPARIALVVVGSVLGAVGGVGVAIAGFAFLAARSQARAGAGDGDYAALGVESAVRAADESWVATLAARARSLFIR